MNRPLPAPTILEAGSKHHAQASSSRRTLIACSLGNALEMYDFTIYSFFAVLIGRHFFPSESALASLLMSLATFGVGFLMRPVGGIIIGRYADRHGRKAALSLTIGLMTLGTALIAFAPTYSQIGIFATFMLVAGRLIQGVSAGGEVGTASVYLMESSTASKRCQSVSWQAASQGYAALVGAGFGFSLSQLLDPASLESWGWRIPFIFGLLIGPVGLYIRNRLPETHEAAAAQEGRQPLDPELLKRIGLGIGLMASSTIGMYLFVFYMPTYLTTAMHYPQSSAMAIAGISSGCMAIICPLAGKFADKYQLRKRLLVWTILAPVVLTLPVFYVLGHVEHMGLAMMCVAALILPTCIGAGAYFALIMEGFPKAQRAFGTSVSYSLGVTLFGGFSPLIATWLIAAMGTPLAPAYYLLVGGAVSLVCLKYFPENKGCE
ncbi:MULTISPECIES: MFS transporter [Pseudomonas]|jgi:MHS family proline/betaine transporter-like MFS transporter|uniref:Major facilitator superfamily MFS_1 n=1 Tax=Pseudomonas putida (strain W619) TaxID=390235 RepID=B1J9S7_PSEPW|nr:MULTISPECIES: MFS transporter [Pseudomonas]MDH1574848.1 MFS transporter [Pseudomonas sp. GD03746]QQE81993.1 MFS transporter [Pseudomonas putida]UTL79281.1 MFS transporter [Pseudomonas putida]HEN8710952.1 MFS transporter [Pseudomonas putida]HEN8716021.1 MFS transporter [Pseudomonas putida]